MIENDRQIIEDAMFISDLHLHPKQPEITQKFLDFCGWAKGRTKSLYILGDFLHAWPGDDAIDSWSEKIINALACLSDFGIKVYFMPGNRDFLIGKKFLKQAKVIALPEQYIVTLGVKKVLLVHGDCYCTDDKAHQRLRRFTRNRLFKLIFLRTPYKYRAKIVNKVRQYSANNNKVTKNMLTVPKAIFKHLRKLNLDTVVHGHIHRAGLTEHLDNHEKFFQYVLSDWDENPLIMCYNSTNEFRYKLFVGS